MLISRPFKSRWSNGLLYWSIAIGTALANFILREALPSRRPNPNPWWLDGLLFLAMGFFFAAAVALAFHERAKPRKEDKWPNLQGEDLKQAALEASRLQERAEASRVQWISVVALVHAGIFSLL